MKLLLALFLIPTICNAQITDTTELYQARISMAKAGREMQLFSRKMTTGTIMTVGGSAIAFLGAVGRPQGPTQSEVKANSFVVAVGSIVALAGLITTFSAHSHVGKAGRYLQNGGIIIPIEGKKKK